MNDLPPTRAERQKAEDEEQMRAIKAERFSVQGCLGFFLMLALCAAVSLGALMAVAELADLLFG